MQRCVWSCGIGALVFLETKIRRRSRNRSVQLPPEMHNESKRMSVYGYGNAVSGAMSNKVLVLEGCMSITLLCFRHDDVSDVRL
jgi:hypothetical protein